MSAEGWPRFLVRRALHGVVVVVAVVILVFIVSRVVGDPVTRMLPIDATAEQRASLTTELGLDQPLFTQFREFSGDVLRGDLGESLWQRRPAVDVVAERLPNTFLLIGCGMAIAVLVSVPLGIVAALRPNSWIDRASVGLSLFGFSAPQFWLGLLLILVFAVRLHWVPTSGMGSAAQLVLPSITLALPTIGRLTALVRSSMIEELNRPWINVERANGIASWRVVGVHALRHAAGPALALGGYDLIRMWGGASVVVESLFAWPGLGLTALDAVEQNDFVLLQAVVIVVAGIIVVTNIAIDVLHKWIDPRIGAV